MEEAANGPTEVGAAAAWHEQARSMQAAAERSVATRFAQRALPRRAGAYTALDMLQRGASRDQNLE
jgi:hypothetical protein